MRSVHKGRHLVDHLFSVLPAHAALHQDPLRGHSRQTLVPENHRQIQAALQHLLEGLRLLHPLPLGIVHILRAAQHNPVHLVRSRQLLDPAQSLSQLIFLFSRHGLHRLSRQAQGVAHGHAHGSGAVIQSHNSHVSSLLLAHKGCGTSSPYLSPILFP